MEIILLTGFSGSGKSETLKRLSSGNLIPGEYLLDLDSEIEKFLNIAERNLGAFITDNGLEKFRDIESECLKNSINFLKSKGGVIALGAGALTDEKVAELQSMRLVKIFWLNVDFEKCYERVLGDENRPVMKRPKEELLDLYEKRKEIYQLADYRWDGEEIDEVLLRKIQHLTNIVKS